MIMHKCCNYQSVNVYTTLFWCIYNIYTTYTYQAHKPCWVKLAASFLSPVRLSAPNWVNIPGNISVMAIPTISECKSFSLTICDQICECLSNNVPSLHNYKYLEIPIWNIKYTLRQESACWPFSTNTISFSGLTLQRIAC